MEYLGREETGEKCRHNFWTNEFLYTFLHRSFWPYLSDGFLKGRVSRTNHSKCDQLGLHFGRRNVGYSGSAGDILRRRIFTRCNFPLFSSKKSLDSHFGKKCTLTFKGVKMASLCKNLPKNQVGGELVEQLPSENVNMQNRIRFK